MKIAASPSIPLVPTTAEARIPPAKNDRPRSAVSDHRSDTVNVRSMELNRQFNMQFLMLQQEMQTENRKSTTLSTVMKTKHQTASAAISSIK